MAKTPNTDKKPLVREPKLNVDLNDEQKEFAKLFYEYDVNFIVGDFGSGKTLAAIHTAIKAFRKRYFDTIWITRPMLDKKMGALPGEIEDKLAPWVFPIRQNLEVCQGKEQTDKMEKEGLIKIMPIQFAKGVTFMKSVVVVDEFQDMTYEDFRTILTRLGEGSKMIFCGSKQQIDKLIGKNSCIYDVMRLKDSGLVSFTELKSNHRNSILTKIINYLENNEDKQ